MRRIRLYKCRVVNLYWDGSGWMLYHTKSKRKVRGMAFRLVKSAALVLARMYGQMWGTHSRPVEVRVHDKQGRYQYAWTYPRSRDPRRSKG